jgi:hypothetical protein
LLGFLIREDPEAWTVFTSDWRVSRVAREKHTRIEPSNLNAEIDAAIEMASQIQHNRDLARRDVEVPDAIKDNHNHFVRPSLFLDMAYFAFSAGRKEAVEPLLRAGFWHAEALTGLNDILAWREFEPAILDLNSGAGRAGLSRRFQRIATEFPSGRYEKQAKEYSRKLEQMAVEDAARQKPESLAQLTTADRMKALIFQLRDCNAVQHTEPGSCWIPSDFQLVEELYVPANAADLLIQEGFDAIPALIEALDDRRLTRSYGVDRSFIPWRYALEVRDAAIQCLVFIADDLWGPLDPVLYHQNNTGVYFSNDKPEARAATIGRVKDWWAKAQAIGEAEWLRSRLRTHGQSRPMLLRRLVKIERNKAVPDVRAWLAEEKHYRTYAYQLLIRTGDAAALAKVKAVADPASANFDFQAIVALNREHHFAPAEYTAALLTGAKTIVQREAGRLPEQLLTALTETGDRECTLLVAERLRGGNMSYTREMGWALGKVDDPGLGAEVTAYFLPFFDVAATTSEGGYRQDDLGKPDIYRVKDDAAFAVNRLLGYPLPDFSDVTPPERDAAIEKLRKICTERGIQPAYRF